MIRQETLTLFPEIEAVTRKMTNEQFGELMRAVMAYRFRGEAYAGKDIAVDIAFQFMASQVDRSETAKAAKSRAAKDRWDKQEDTDGRQPKRMQTDAEAMQPDAEAMQTDAKGMHSDAKGMHSDAEGMQTDAEAMQTDAEGMQTDAEAMQSDAEGMHSDAKGMQTDANACSSPVQSRPVPSRPIQSNPVPSESKAGKPPAPARRAYGEFGWVRLSDPEYARLVGELGEGEVRRCIAYVDEAAQATGNKNKWRDWSVVVRKCSKNGWGQSGGGGYGKRQVPMGATGQLGQAELEAIQRVLREN